MKARLIIVLAWVLAIAGTGRVGAHEDLMARILRLTEELNANPTNADRLIQRGDIYRLHGNWQEAWNDYAAAGKLVPDSAALLLGQAQLHVDLGEDPAARTAFDKYLARIPTNSMAWFGRARVLNRLGERKAAIADYSRGLAVAGSPQPEEFLERASLQATEFGPEAAIKGLDEGLTRFGWVVAFQKAAIEYELKRQRPDQALARLETIILRANRKETWLLWKGEILVTAGKSLEAREAFMATLKAIDALPVRMRLAPGMVQLRAKVEASMGSLRASDDEGKK